MVYIFDTNALMNEPESIVFDNAYIPVTVLEELDKHNHFGNPEQKYKARRAMRFLDDKKDVIKYLVDEYKEIEASWMDSSSKDNIILKYAAGICDVDKGAILYTLDRNMSEKAKALNIPCVLAKESDKDVYKGYKEICMTDEEYSDFCTKFENDFDLLENEYLIIYNSDGKLFDRYKWTKDGFKVLNTRSFKSQYWDVIKPLESDPTQACAFDSLYTNDITMLLGRAGSGKTTLALGFLMSQLALNKINKIHIVHTFETLKEAKTLGFLPGTKEEKIFDSSLGDILASKFGSCEFTIKPLIQSNKLEIVPTSDIRGVEFGENDAVFLTEAQNTTPYVMKTLVQRCKSGCKLIIEGDMLEQEDIRCEVNGMERLSDVFKGTKYFGCVKLKYNNRNPIGELADKI